MNQVIIWGIVILIVVGGLLWYRLSLRKNYKLLSGKGRPEGGFAVPSTPGSASEKCEERTPKGPNSTDPEMVEQLRVNKERIETIKRSRACELVEAVLAKYQEELPKADVLEFTVCIDRPIVRTDLDLVVELLRRKGWVADHAPSARGTLFHLTPDAWIEKELEVPDRRMRH